MIITENDFCLTILNLEEKERELTVKTRLGAKIMDFKIFGEQENRIVAVTEDCYVFLYRINFETRRERLSTITNFSEELEELKKPSLSLSAPRISTS